MIDVHCHWDDIRFENQMEVLLEEGKTKNIRYWISSALDKKSFREHLNYQKKYPEILVSRGIHPNDTQIAHRQMDDFKKDAESSSCIAIGECGLDFSDGLKERKEQTELFIYQAKTAFETNKPMILHIRKAYYEFFKLYKKERFLKDIPIIFHSFSGPEEIIDNFKNYNFFFSFSGAFTARRAVKLRKKMSLIPIDRIFFETDAPYIKPFDLPGKYNLPTNITHIYQRGAEVLNISTTQLIEQIQKNWNKIFQIKK